MKGTLRQCRVFVQVESGEKHMVLAYDHETVWQLKQRVFEVTDVMPHQQQLFRVGKKETKELENTKLLSKSKVKNGSQLSMLVDKPEEGNLVSPRPSESVAPAALSPRKPASAVSVPRLPSLAGLHPASCFAFGTGLRQAIAGYQTAFCVYLCTQRGVQIGAADAIAEGCVEVLVSGTPADVVLSARADGVLEVSYTAFSATNDANIDVKVDGVSIGNCEGGQMGLEVREGEAGRLVETAGWAGAALEALAGEAERSGSLASLGPAPLTPFSALKAPALLPLQRVRMQRTLARLYEALLSEDANKVQLVQEHALPLCGALLSSGVAHVSRFLHMFVCRFAAVTSAPLTSAASAEDLLRVPEALQRGEDLPWKRVFGQALAAVAPPDSPAALRVLLSIAPGTEKSALALMERMGREGRWEAVLNVEAASRLLARSLHSEPEATCFVLDARRRGGAAITERLHSSGLVQAVVHAFALVDVPPLWEPKILEAYAPSTRGHVLGRDASQAALRLLDCAGALGESFPTSSSPSSTSFQLLAALVALLRAADLSLGRASFLVLQRWLTAARAESDVGEALAAADGLGALAELAMRCDAASLPLVDPILDLLASVCRGTSTPNSVDAPVIPWLVARLKSAGGAKQASIIVLIYFARIERYKSRVVAAGGFDFLSELIRMVRSENVSILRRIPEDALELQKEIGSGACSRVWLAKWNHKQVAVKMFNENYAAFSEKEFGSELAIMSVLRHPNICHAFGGSDTPGHRFLVMPIYRRGSLLDVIRNPDIALSNFRILSMCVDAAVGMAFLHECGVLHRDLKSGNLLVDDNWRIAVVDFGISRMIDLSMSKKNIGTAIYSSPEVLCGKPYSFSADVYSFSFVIWELLSRQVPYKNHKQAFIINGVCNDNMRPPEPKDCPKALWMLIRQCWAQEPSDRPTFASVVSTLKRLQSNIGALNSLKSVSKDNRITMQMAKAFRTAGDTPKEPLDRPSEATKWATLGRNVPFPDLNEAEEAPHDNSDALM